VTEPKKATDVIYDIDKKINLIIELFRVTDLNQKILINKLKETVERLDRLEKNPITTPVSNQAVSGFKIEATDIKTNAEMNLQVEAIPKGFRRNSRPETYSGDNEYVKNVVSPVENISSQQIKQNTNKQEFAPQIDNSTFIGTEIKVENKEQLSQPTAGNILTQQRVVNKNGKSVFLADVEIVNLDNNTATIKTRTNAAGKWSSALSPGNYRITLKKMDAASKEKIEISQDIVVDGRVNPLDIPMVIIK